MIEGGGMVQRGVPERKKGRPPLDADRRRAEILGQVTPLFLERGYDGVSLNEIVDLVGGSKTTIYSLFGGKEGLLEALVRQMTTEVALGIDLDATGSLEAQLTRIGNSFLKLVLTPKVLEFHRLMVSIGRTFPSAGRAFFEAGPVLSTSIIAGWIERQQQAGLLAEGDPQDLARLFHDMLIGSHQLGWLTSHPGGTDPDKVAATVRLAVKMFLNGCATHPSDI